MSLKFVCNLLILLTLCYSRVSISALKVCPSCGPAVKEHVLPNSLALSSSSLLQDLALEPLLALFEEIVVSGAVTFHDLLSMLRDRLEQASSSKNATVSGGKSRRATLPTVTDPATPRKAT